MGRPNYNFNKRNREQAKQQKQLDKAARRLQLKQDKADQAARTEEHASEGTEELPLKEPEGDSELQ